MSASEEEINTSGESLFETKEKRNNSLDGTNNVGERLISQSNTHTNT